MFVMQIIQNYDGAFISVFSGSSADLLLNTFLEWPIHN